MRCFRQPLAFLFLFIGFCALAWSQPAFTSLRSSITDPSAALPPGATVTTMNYVTTMTSTQPIKSRITTSPGVPADKS
jgi:hypothetical protein